MVNASDVVPVLDAPIFSKNENVTLIDATGDKIIIGIQDESKAHEIPDSISGFEVVKINFPRMKAFNCDICSPSCDTKRTERVRPIIGGISVSHYRATAGTIGCIVKDSTDKAYILSNNHVLAKASTLQNPRANPGDPVYSPGNADGGSSADTVATLSDYIALDEEGPNTMDAAIAEITAGTEYQEGWMGDSGGIIYPNGISNDVAVGDACYKYGRTTGYSENIVISTNASVAVEYEGGLTIHFRGQILFLANPAYENPICGGDSGAALLNTRWNLIGLCFAGGEDNYGMRIGTACYIAPVLETLGMEVPYSAETNSLCDPGATRCLAGQLFACDQYGTDWKHYGPSSSCGATSSGDAMGGVLKALGATLPFMVVLGIIMSGKK